MSEIVDLFGGPLDGKRFEWPSPLPPEIHFPKAVDLARRVWKRPASEPLPITILVYQHVSLGLYRFKEERER